MNLSAHHQFLAGGTGLVAGAAGAVTDASTGDTGLGILTQLGVAGLLVVIVLYMLRRSDEHDAARIRDLKDQIKTEQHRADEAEAALRRRTPP